MTIVRPIFDRRLIALYLRMISKNAMLFIFITIVIDATGLGIIIPSLPDLIADVSNVTFDESKTYYGFIVAAYALMQWFFAPIIGGLSDRFGRRPVLLISLLGLSVDYMVMYFAPSLFWLVLGRCLSGMFGASYTTATAYIADISTKENKTKNFGMVGAAFGIGFIVGPAIGGFLGDVGIRVPFLLAGGLSFVNFIYGFFVLKETLPKEKRRPFSMLRSNAIGAFIQMWKYKALGLLFGVIFLYYIAGTAIQVTWVYLTEEKFDFTKTDIGISLAIVGVCVAIVQGGLAGIFAKRLGEVKTAYIGLLMYFLAVVGIGFAGHGWMLYALMLPYAFSGLAGPTIQAIMSNNTSEREQGELQGSITSLVSMAEFLGPLLMMYLLATFTVGLPMAERNYGVPYFVAAGFVIIASMLFYFAVKKRK
ncbi:MAG: DHA1 family tetracycline resistance protein-like MFS transporter [Crocinitomicaceae bacterium]|jgi:DHA1 family tetracycline resistance protein-like MFS transporter